MTTEEKREEIIERVKLLDHEQQLKVLAFIEQLKAEQEGQQK